MAKGMAITGTDSIGSRRQTTYIQYDPITRIHGICTGFKGPGLLLGLGCRQKIGVGRNSATFDTTNNIFPGFHQSLWAIISKLLKSILKLKNSFDCDVTILITQLSKL